VWTALSSGLVVGPAAGRQLADGESLLDRLVPWEAEPIMVVQVGNCGYGRGNSRSYPVRRRSLPSG